ncbi:NAD(+) diphosphatase [Sphingomonas naphthae]|uniref:NAD(+) diphosphatase n=1 Tax=Sphingomonas naphthae TaxID=1813468 RepID=A0ABY7TMZ8_9SPHN|nr:NAD(+) diphosphatase [Sphingomonas naphthae]WCT74602.1 NAD(+) diphosphatase [Sphingomonas naphthae]
MTPPGFTGSTLDRADAIRSDPAAIAALAADPGARLLDLAAYEPVATDAGRLGWAAMPGQDDTAFLGFVDGAPCFVAIPSPAPAARRTATLFPILDRLVPEDAATYAAARSLADWHARHHHCANCGQPTAPFRAGWGRRCDACRTEHFPRTDPVVIMLAEIGEGEDARVLVGRQPAFPKGRYSALAGFVEVGESIEEAVRRELHEEAGVPTGAVRYVASQPWPFASSLMIACIAAAENEAITLDTTELEAAMWVTRADVRAALDGAPDAPFIAPPPYAIANTLFRRWVAGA